MRKINVVHCCGTMNVGGAETMVMNWYHNINRENFEFNFLVFNKEKGVFDDEIRSLGGTIYYVPSLGEAGIIGYIYNLIKVFKKIPCVDVIHSHMDWQGGFIAFAAFLAGVKKRVIHSHAMQEMFQSSILHRFMVGIGKKLIKIFATDRLCCSEVAGKSLFENRKMYVLKNAIDLNKFSEVSTEKREQFRKKYNIGANDFVLGCVGSLSENKNQIFLLNLLKELDIHMKLILVGEGNSEQDLKKKAKEIEVQDRVIFTGLQRDISGISSLFDVFLFPSKREGLGIVVIEMQAMGIPCIISEGVPMDVDMGLGLVRQISLKNKEEWLKSIQNQKKREKKNQSICREKIKENGYDIIESTRLLEKIYCEK